MALSGIYRLGDLSHGDGGLHAGGLPLLLQKSCRARQFITVPSIPHVVATGTIDTGLLQFGTAEEVAAADHDGHLHTLLYGRNDLLGNATNHLGIDADLATTECFAGQLEQNSARIVAISHIVPFSKPKVRNYP